MQPDRYVETSSSGAWHVRDSRVSLASIVRAFQEGLSAEAISRECFPTLSLEQVYGAITFYLANRAEVDRLMQADTAEAERWRAENGASQPEFVAKMAAARASLLAHA